MDRLWIAILTLVLAVVQTVALAEDAAKKGSGEEAPPPPAAFGHLQVNVNAPNARVFVDGAFWGEAHPGKPLNLQHVGVGEVTVRAEAPGRKVVSKRFRLAPDQWTQAVLVLPPKIQSDTLRAGAKPSQPLPKSSTPGPPPKPASGALEGELKSSGSTPEKSTGVSPEIKPDAESADSVLSKPFEMAPDSEGKVPPSIPIPESVDQPPEPPAGTREGDMVYVPSGAFQMGADQDDEKPVHAVFVAGFWMDQYEVTVAKFKEFQPGYQPSAHSSCETCPASAVTWADAVAYCESQGKRLPTEAEWEKACQGPGGHVYAWGNEADRTEGLFGAEWNDKAVPVGSFSANGYDLYEMSGNVWEWVQDYYDEHYYRRSPTKNPMGPDSGSRRVIRGGSWYGGEDNVQCSRRFRAPPDRRSRIIGFRCVR